MQVSNNTNGTSFRGALFIKASEEILKPSCSCDQAPVFLDFAKRKGWVKPDAVALPILTKDGFCPILDGAEKIAIEQPLKNFAGAKTSADIFYYGDKLLKTAEKFIGTPNYKEETIHINVFNALARQWGLIN